jgi:hypothetical protein
MPGCTAYKDTGRRRERQICWLMCGGDDGGDKKMENKKGLRKPSKSLILLAGTIP